MPPRVFLLSPARCSGPRCRQLVDRRAAFELAVRLRAEGAPLGEVMSFLSALYFRGKLAYAQRFAAPPTGCPGVLVITPGRGLVAPEAAITSGDLRAFGRVPIDAGDRRYAEPLRKGALALRARLPGDAEIVLLGSIATPKYVDILRQFLGARLKFPAEFVGRGDMSRGGVLLRAVEAGEELAYVPVSGATLKGVRPPKLPRK